MTASPVTVMQLVDTLAVGGAERMAVNLANALPRDRFRSHLCSTRSEGPLAAAVADDVVRLELRRTRRLAPMALVRLVLHIRRHDVSILHAHSNAVFAAVLAASFPPYPAVVWHDHFGPELASRSIWPLRLLVRRLAHVIPVSDTLARWAVHTLGVPSERVSYVPNFVPHQRPSPSPVALPGVEGRRVACVANLRPQKDHGMVIAAFANVVAAVNDAHLLLMGVESDADYAAELREAVARVGIEPNVSWLGARDDVAAVLRGCTIGVLGSLSEGLPLALLEYGMAGLPVVTTSVGQCAAVVDGGAAGVLVPPADPIALGAAVVALLRDPARRTALGSALQLRVAERYGGDGAIRAITSIYDSVAPGARLAGAGTGRRRSA